MITLPEGNWSPADSDGGSFLTGAAAPLPLGTFRLPDDPHLLAPAVPDDDPVARADTMRERAGGVFSRHRAVGAFNRELDDLFTNIAEGTDWAQGPSWLTGLDKFDKESAALRQKHLAELRSPDDRAAFERHTQEFTAMQRIGLKRALTERQHADALAQLDDQLAYYAGKAAAAPNDVFRQIAIDAGERAIAELRDAGYLFPEAAAKRQQAFLGLIDGADLESIVTANPDEAFGILDNPTLFPNADNATRERLKMLLRPMPMPTDVEPPTIRTMDYREDRDGPPPELLPLSASTDEDAAAEGSEPPSGPTNIDDIAEALAPLVENNDGLRELLGELQETPDDPNAAIRLAAGLLDISPGIPEAAGRKSLKDVIPWLLEKGRDLITRGRDAPSKPSPHPQAPKESGADAAPKPSRREPTAEDPVGRRGERPEHKVREGTNPPTNINDREYSGHALDEMQNSGFTPTVIEHAIQNGVTSTGDKGENLHYDSKNNLTVATDKQTGRVISTWPGRPGKRNR